jgi:hypothetical protein
MQELTGISEYIMQRIMNQSEETTIQVLLIYRIGLTQREITLNYFFNILNLRDLSLPPVDRTFVSSI